MHQGAHLHNIRVLDAFEQCDLRDEGVKVLWAPNGFLGDDLHRLSLPGGLDLRGIDRTVASPSQFGADLPLTNGNTRGLLEVPVDGRETLCELWELAPEEQVHPMRMLTLFLQQILTDRIDAYHAEIEEISQCLHGWRLDQEVVHICLQELSASKHPEASLHCAVLVIVPMEEECKDARMFLLSRQLPAELYS